MAGIKRYELKDKLLYIGMYDSAIKNKEKIGEITKDNIYLLSALSMNKEKTLQVFDEIKRFSPTYIRGYASACFIFAKQLKELHLTLNIKAVLTSSDQLHEYMRHEIEEVFNCKVFDFYGQNEDIATAAQCQENNVYHINMENNYIYTDENNNIIATHLEHYLMPLLNYQVNDLGELHTNYKCNYGFESDVFTKIIGRNDDYLISKQGNKYAAGALNQPMKNEFNSIKEIQYIQNNINTLTINYVKGVDFNHSTLEKLKINIELFTQREFVITFNEYNMQIPRLPNGKFRLIIRSFKDNNI